MNEKKIERLVAEARNQEALAWDMHKWYEDEGNKQEAEVWAARWAIWHDVLYMLGEEKIR